MPGSDPLCAHVPVRPRAAARWIALGALAAAGTALLLWFTHRGIGLWEDTFDYVTSALSLASTGALGRVDGLGEFRPLTHFPPGYPAALALLSLLGLDVYVAARWISALSFGATVGLVGLAGMHVTGSVVAGILAAGLVLTSEVVIGVHLWALSEPLYMFLSFLTLIVLAFYLRSPHKRAWLWAAAVAGGLAFLTRFVGISLLLAAALVLVAYPHADPRRRIFDGVAFTAAAAAPTGAFLLRNLLISGNPADLTQMAWHIPTADQWNEAARTILNWSLPDFVVDSLRGNSAMLIMAVVIVLGAAGVLWFARREFAYRASSGGRWQELALLCLSYGVAYVLAVLITVGLVHRTTPLDDRILSPLYPIAVLLGIGLLGEIWRAYPGTARWAVAAVSVLVAAFQLARFRGLVLVLPEDSRGFASNAWQASETVEYVRGLPGVPIYSNEIQAIYFLTGRTAIFIPTPLNPATGGTREDYEDALARMRERLGAEDGALVLVNPDEISPDQMRDLLEGLYLEATLSDGLVYRAGPPGS